MALRGVPSEPKPQAGATGAVATGTECTSSIRMTAPRHVRDQCANKLRWSLAHGWKRESFYDLCFMAERQPSDDLRCFEELR